MKTLIDIYSDFGEILSASSDNESRGMGAANVIDQLPTIWGTDQNISHSITGSLKFIDDVDDFLCPIDSFIIVPYKLPVNSTITIKIYNDDGEISSNTIVTSVENENIKFLDFDVVLGRTWELTIDLPYSTDIKILRVMVGQLWKPNREVSGDLNIELTPFVQAQRQRNGGVFTGVYTSIKTISVSYLELEPEILFQLQDMLSRYSSGASIYMDGLVNTGIYNQTSIFGRIREWGKPVKSISGNFSINLTIESYTVKPKQLPTTELVEV